MKQLIVKIKYTKREATYEGQGQRVAWLKNKFNFSVPHDERYWSSVFCNWHSVFLKTKTKTNKQIKHSTNIKESY